MSLLTLPADNGTWSVTIFTASGDQPLKSLRHEEKWTNTVRGCPLHAHWLDGEPITGVLPMSGVVDRYRRFVVDGSPVATGFVAVADAWACTNPSAGRGSDRRLPARRLSPRRAVERHPVVSLDDRGRSRSLSSPLEYIGTITPVQDILRRPAVAEGIRAGREAMKGTSPAPMPGPSRQQLLELVR